MTTSANATFSLDGWDEAPYEETGFTIGPATEDLPDDQTAAALYDVLEQQVLPLFFDRNEQGLPLDSPLRNYRDPHHKPELVAAVTRFVGMKGFRPVDEIARGLGHRRARGPHRHGDLQRPEWWRAQCHPRLRPLRATGPSSIERPTCWARCLWR
jgi:hypothetical protein